MSDVKCARMLLGAAERDVQALQNMGDASAFSEEIFGFHVQQATEKLFKAWLALLGEVYPLTHNLELLLELLQERGTAMSSFRTLIEYTPYAVRFRYEPIDTNVQPIAREQTLHLVESLLAEVQRQFAEVEGRN